MAANDFLDREQKGELLEMIIDTVLNGVEPTSDDRAVIGVYNQFMAVIGRKAEGVIKKLNALDEVNAEKKKGKEEPEKVGKSSDIKSKEFLKEYESQLLVDPLFVRSEETEGALNFGAVILAAWDYYRSGDSSSARKFINVIKDKRGYTYEMLDKIIRMKTKPVVRISPSGVVEVN